MVEMILYQNTETVIFLLCASYYQTNDHRHHFNTPIISKNTQQHPAGRAISSD